VMRLFSVLRLVAFFFCKIKRMAGIWRFRLIGVS
jgi:hypothetical protein